MISKGSKYTNKVKTSVKAAVEISGGYENRTISGHTNAKAPTADYEDDEEESGVHVKNSDDDNETGEN